MSEIKPWEDRLPSMGGNESDEMRSMQEEITELRARVADLEKDAGRYRWLKISDWYVGPDSFFCGEGGDLLEYDNMSLGGNSLDEEIDAEMNKPCPT